MPLILPENDVESHKLPGQDSVNQLPVTKGKGKGKGKQVQVNKLSRSELFVVCLYLCMLSLINRAINEKISASSFYPGRGDNAHPLARLDPEDNMHHTPDVDDENSETEDDSDDENAVELALKAPNKFSESLAIEVSSRCFGTHPYLLLTAVTEALVDSTRWFPA